MSFDIFLRRKKSILSKKDRSFKGSLDKKISKLCKKINSIDNFYTTSSCSGRVVLMIDQEKKSGGLFLWVNHNLITLRELKKEINKAKLKKKNIKFKQDPCIIHIACKNLEDAKHFLEIGFRVGFKKSGILYLGKRIVVELNCSEKLEFPIIAKGKILVTNEFLKTIIKKTNKNLKAGWKKINDLTNNL